MARAYSQDLRDRVLLAAADGSSARAAAARFGIGAKTAIEWVRRARETGERQARQQGQPKGTKLDAHEGFLLSLVAQTDDLTLAAMQARLRAEKGVSTGLSPLWRFFKARGLSYKKSRRMRASRSART